MSLIDDLDDWEKELKKNPKIKTRLQIAQGVVSLVTAVAGITLISNPEFVQDLFNNPFPWAPTALYQANGVVFLGLSSINFYEGFIRKNGDSNWLKYFTEESIFAKTYNFLFPKD